MLRKWTLRILYSTVTYLEMPNLRLEFIDELEK